MKPVKTPQAGDILYTDRFLYRHYGIYAGNGKVIHYAAGNGDFGADVRVSETSLKQFAGDGEYGVAQIAENLSVAKQFSGKETVRRAQSRLGEESYNLLFNNCEHFALWCKTGRSKSVQVETAFTATIVLGAIAVTAHLVKSSEEG
jgi:cell wall-associated NlpC family hydrolase